MPIMQRFICLIVRDRRLDFPKVVGIHSFS